MKKHSFFGTYLDVFFCNIIFLFFSNEVLIAQQVIDSILILSAYDNIPLKNVVVSNTKNNTIEYTNEKGIALIKYESDIDSIKIYAPTYQNIFVRVADIKQKNYKVSLFPKEVSLKPLFIRSRFDRSDKSFIFKPKYKKRYDVGFEGPVEIISLYRHRHKKNKKVSSISFYLKNISEQPEVWIALLLYRVSEQILKPIIVESHEIALIDSRMKEINIPLRYSSLKLETGESYLVGFRIIDPSKKYNILVNSIKSSKKTKTLFRTPFDVEWIDLSNDGEFSIYYEIYFE